MCLCTADELIIALSTSKGTIHKVFTKAPLAFPYTAASEKVLCIGMQLMDDDLFKDDVDDRKRVDEDSKSDVEPPKKKALARRAAPAKAASKKAAPKEPRA
ncbi:hypothetical protein HWV62_20451 [Athelia sp. TMB]|nr:hypothetical protein HWV62_20451 [Athelia sp. TMB]